MDKTEKLIKDELSMENDKVQLDMDAIIAGTHASIKRRSTQRKALYSSPVAILLVILGMMLFPGNDEASTLAGGELFMADWEYSWTNTQELELEAVEGGILYDQTVNYLFDEDYFTYLEDAEALLDEVDLEALKGYLKEA